MVEIEVKSSDVVVKEGSFDDGRPWKSRQQVAYLFTPGKPYPTEFVIKLGANGVPYEPGYYQLAPESVQVYRGRLELARQLKLVPLAAAQAKSA